MVKQVAYELLLAHTNENLEDNDSLAEFVDQCKVRMSDRIRMNRSKGKRHVLHRRVVVVVVAVAVGGGGVAVWVSF